MTCREFTEFIIDYLSGELPWATQAEFDHHLRICENCRRYLASYEASVRLGKGAFENPDAEVPREVPEQLVKAILAARRQME